MRVLSVDPGSEKSGWCLLDDGVPQVWGWDANDDLRQDFHKAGGMDIRYGFPPDHLAIEYIYLRGMKVYQQTIDTVLWAGRLIEAWNGPFTLIDRKDEKMMLCGNMKADDTSIRIAIIDRFGGPDKAIGGKKCQTCKGKGWRGRAHDYCEGCHCVPPDNEPALVDGMIQGTVGCGYETHPGVLHGVSGHVWSAIAVGLTYLAQEAK